jgi:hypothetical protein
MPVTLAASLGMVGFGPTPRSVAAGTVGWTVSGLSEPSHFSTSDDGAPCVELKKKCDRYAVLVMNVGEETSSATGTPVTVVDTLPQGMAPLGKPRSGEGLQGAKWHCSSEEVGSQWTVTCTLETSEGEPGVVPADGYAPYLAIAVTSPTAAMAGMLSNEISVTGGGTTAVTASSVKTEISSQTPPFEVSDFAFEAGAAGGGPSLLAGGHPWEMTVTFGVPVVIPPSTPPPEVERPIEAVENVKKAVVELPMGIIGNPQAIPHCTQPQLLAEECPSGSRVGVYALAGGESAFGQFETTGGEGGTSPLEGACCSAIFNMVPEKGYPAEFAFTFGSIVIPLYAEVVHTPKGYRLRVFVPGISNGLEIADVSTTFFGDPGKVNEEGSGNAFLSNPSACASGPLTARIELESWEQPGRVVSKEATVYPQLTECNLLQGAFKPSIDFAPSPSGPEGGTTQADEPSGFTFNLEIPQKTGFEEAAVPEIRNATVVLPAGVSIDPSVATGLQACSETGPTGINIGSDDVEPDGRDVGNPEATELGANHGGPGGNSSPYDDGVYHTAPGHCPAASTIGTVEACTPLLPNRANKEGVKEEGEKACEEHPGIAPLRGHAYVAEPKCGGAAQPACTEASATNGELFGLYFEVEGSGVIVKLAGKVSANPGTGQLTSTFSEDPQLPFSDLKLNLDGGPRAPLATPQECGEASSAALLEPWSAPEAGNANPTSQFDVDWDGHGGACPSSLPLTPGFTAGTVTPVAGGFSPLTLTLTRHDREQDLSGLTVNTPPGLLGKLSSVPLCEEPQAAAGTCSEASLIGHDHIGVGAGTEPFFVEGRVYLTGPHNGAPFGLSIVNPAVAGPFNLGNVVVQAAIHVNPATGAITTVSDPFPQLKDGIPLRVQTIDLVLDRPGFLFNPTNCAQKQITATVTGAQGATAAVASPFAVTGCSALPFKPSFSLSTQGKTSKVGGASLAVDLTQTPGEANIEKVDVQLPLALPSRLSTLQQACTAAQFNANPSGCPAGSDVGTATAVTPVLNVALKGPGYLVSRGAEFPDLEFVLQGQGVEIVLDGQTDIKKGITYSNFETVPDAPVTSFQAEFPEGPHSVLAANVNLCALTKIVTVSKRVTRRVHGHKRRVTIKVKETITTPLSSPTTIVGQNGAVIKQTTKIAVTGCPKVKVTKKPPKPTGKHKKK